MRFALIITLAVVFILSGAGHTFAQKQHYKFNNLTLAEGLTGFSVNSMYQDSFGFMWICTEDGVQYFDGRDFVTFQRQADDTTGLFANEIYNVAEDFEKNIWIGTVAGLNKYIRKTGEVVRMPPPVEAEIESPVYKILNDPADSTILWMTTYAGYLVKYSIITGERTLYPIPVSQHDTPDILAMIPYPGDTTKLLLTSANLHVFNKRNGEFTSIYQCEQKPGEWNNRINALVLEPGNPDVLWMATGDYWGRGSTGGIVKFVLSSRKSTIYTKYNRPGEFSGLQFLTLCFDSGGRLWAGSRNAGLLLFDIKKDEFFEYRKIKGEDGTFATDKGVKSIIMDRSQSMWFGSWGDGISVLHQSAQKFRRFQRFTAAQKYITENDVTAFAEDSKGYIWVSTLDGGLYRFDPRTSAFDSRPLKRTGSNTGREITTLYCDSRDNLWIGTYSDGLYRYHVPTGQTVHFPYGSGVNAVSAKRITAITESPDGEIYISTYGGGLNIYNYSTAGIIKFLYNPDDPSAIPDNQIWLPVFDKDGVSYFSGNGIFGIIRFDRKRGSFSTIRPDAGVAFTMPVITDNGDVYLNCNSSAMVGFRFDSDKPLYPLAIKGGGYVRGAVSVLADNMGNLWMGTGNGLLYYKPATKVMKRFNKSDGLISNDFAMNAAYKSRNGTMYFGGINGFISFQPEDIKLSGYEPPLAFTGLKIFQEKIEAGKNSILPENIMITREIVLAYDQNDFTVSFAAMDFSAPDNIAYKYTLVNHDAEWIASGNKNYASYTNLDPGEYILRVVASNSDGIWKLKPAEMKIIIRPPFWRTIWAYIAYGILFVWGIYGLDKFQKRRLTAHLKVSARIREAELRAQIAEKESSRKSFELDQARELQLSMLPKKLPVLPQIEVAVFMRTASEVGGDYYDFHVHPDDSLTVLLGDATGHGMQSGMMVSIIKSLFMTDRGTTDITGFLQKTNTAIKEMELGRLLMALTILHINGRNLKMTNAGMPPMLLYRSSKRTAEEIVINNMPLGAMRNSSYESAEITLEAGDTILLLSDGYAEQMNENQGLLGYQKTKEIFEEAAEEEPHRIIEYMKQKGYEWSEGKDNEDDITFVVIRIK